MEVDSDNFVEFATGTLKEKELDNLEDLEDSNVSHRIGDQETDRKEEAGDDNGICGDESVDDVSGLHMESDFIADKWKFLYVLLEQRKFSRNVYLQSPGLFLYK